MTENKGERSVARFRLVSEDGQHLTVIEYREVLEDADGHINYGDSPRYVTLDGHEAKRLDGDSFEVVDRGFKGTVVEEGTNENEPYDRRGEPRSGA